MPRISLPWLADHVEVPQGLTASQLAADLVRVGLEEEAIHSSGVTGPVVVGRVVSLEAEPQKMERPLTGVRWMWGSTVFLERMVPLLHVALCVVRTTLGSVTSWLLRFQVQCCRVPSLFRPARRTGTSPME